MDPPPEFLYTGPGWEYPEPAEQRPALPLAGLPNLLLPPAEGVKVDAVAPAPSSIVPVVEALRRKGYRGLPADMRRLEPRHVPQVLPAHQRPAHVPPGRPLYEPLFRRIPELGDINQQQLGDCWFLAALAAIVHAGTGNAIRRMLCDSYDHAYVRLWEMSRQPRWIRVEKSLLAVKSTPAVFHSIGGLWPAMLERAMTAIDWDKGGSYVVDPQGASYGRLPGGSADIALEALLGVATRTWEIADDPYHYRSLSDDYQTLKKILGGDHTDRPSPVIQGALFDSLVTQPGYPTARFYEHVWERWANLTNIAGWLAQSRQPFHQVRVYRLEDFQRFMWDFAARAINQAHWAMVMHSIPPSPRGTSLWGSSPPPTAHEAVDCVCRWARERQIFSGRRGTGVYTDAQVRLYRDIEAHLLVHRPLVLSTRATVSNKPRDPRSVGLGSSGETQARGLAASHGYAVVGCHTTDTGLCFVQVFNPWGAIGRGYTFAPAALQLKPSPAAIRRAQVLATGGQKPELAYETESPVFWLELTDVTKRCGWLMSCTSTPDPIREGLSSAKSA
jgi:hypothetical protein